MYQIALFLVKKYCKRNIYVRSLMTVQRKWDLCET